MFSPSRLARMTYVFALVVVLSLLLLGPSPSRGQFRGSPTIYVPIRSGSSASGGLGAAGFIGGAAGSSSGSLSNSITLAQIRFLGMPPPLFMPVMFNANTDTTAMALFMGHSPFGLGIMLPLGMTVMSGMLGGAGGGAGSFASGGMGMGGMGMRGGMGMGMMRGGMGGMGMGGMGMGGMGMRGGMGGFAGKGMRGFNGGNAL